jgi:glycosyltransferase involved in cell wall biosynthesis
LGRVSEEEKWKLMAQAKGFLALSRDEDFGITPVEAQMAGTPVIAYDGGGYRESVVNENTGVRFGDYSVDGLLAAMDRFRKIEWNRKAITRSADKFDSKKFREEFERVVNGIRPRIREGLGR